jgi:phosphatidylglycerophosphate synthase
MNRRPLNSRGTRWAAAVAGFLARKGVKPNWISLGSVVCSLAAGVLFASLQFADVAWRQIALLAAGAVCVQLRLLCNLFDGMVAVEGGFKTPSGEIFNDFPDRLSDPLILIGAGYCAGLAGPGPVLGWAAGVLSVLTAYTRILGAASGAAHYFIGPMAKQHRMALITVAALLSAGECAFEFRGYVFGCALLLIVVGCIVTIIRRLRRIIGELENDA